MQKLVYALKVVVGIIQKWTEIISEIVVEDCSWFQPYS
jgi:hypothetical protein